jgi:chorismate mutase
MGKKDASLNLQELRSQIDQIDTQIAEALNKRAAIVEEVWTLKQQNQFPFIDQGRENAIFARVRSLSKEPLTADSMENIFQCILNEVRPRIKSAKAKSG